MSASNPSIGGKRLDSWKEIAAFFGRDERTVSRWEKELGLPVHRLPGAKGRVYAYTEELSAWLEVSGNAGTRTGETEPKPEAGSRTATLSIVGGQTPTDETASAESGEIAPGDAAVAVNGRRWKTARLVAGAVLIAAVLGFTLFYRSHAAGNSAGTPRAKNDSGAGQASPHDVVLASQQSHDPEAEQLYLKGRYYWNKRTPDDLNKALDYFMQAVVHDPNYSQAYVGLADCYNLMREYTLMPSSEAYPRALAAAKKAVELDDQSSEAHASLAFVSFFGMWDLATGEREFRRAIDLNPNNATSHHWYANALFALRRLPEALVEIDRAQALDPASTSILADKANILDPAGRPDESFTLLKQLESREPTFRSPHGYLMGAYLQRKDYPNYLSELRKDALLVHDENELAIATAAEKGFAEHGARGMFEGMLLVQKKLYAQHLVSPTDLAKTCALRGNKNEALEYLKTAYEQRDSGLLFVEIFKELDSLHGEPEYRDLLARMGLPPQN
jgi:tetratricopeptide (TPR) repeat protein